MKILKLRFKNINSLKGEHTIDFASKPLSETGIFAITGPTGSGKSTILDAISLALYNRIPRIGSLSKSSVENFGAIITRNTDDCFTEVEYEIHGKQYRSKWEISRNRNGNLRDYTMEISKLSGEIIENKKSEVVRKNEEIIGLNYDQFIKSIILSQGEFAKFLKADATERSELLEKITGTEIYRQLGRAAFQKQKDENQKLDQLNFQIGEIKLLDDEEIKTLDENIKTANIEVSKLKNINESNRKLLQTKLSIDKLQTELSEHQKKLELIEKEIITFKPKKFSLQNHEKLIVLKSDINETLSFEKQLKAIQLKIKQLNEKLAEQNQNKENYIQIISTLKTNLIAKQKELEALKPTFIEVRTIDNSIIHQQKKINEETSRFNKLNSDYKTAETEIEKLGKLIELDSEKLLTVQVFLSENKLIETLINEFSLIKTKEEEVTNLTSTVDASLKKSIKLNGIKDVLKLKNKTKEHEALQTILKNNKSQLFEFQSLSKYSGVQLSEISFSIDKLKTELSALEKQEQYCADYLEIKSNLKKLDAKEIFIASEIEIKTIAKSRTENEFEIVIQELEELKIRHKRQQLEAKYKDDRLKLKPEEACFLCGSTNHPYVKQYTAQLDETSKLLKQKEKEEKELAKSIQDVDKQINSLQKDLEYAKNEIIEKTQKAAILVQQFEKISEQFELKNSIENENSISELKIENQQNLSELQTQKANLEKITELENQIQQNNYLLEKFDTLMSVRKDFNAFYQKYKQFTIAPKNFTEIISQLENAISEYKKNLNEHNILNTSISGNKLALTEKNNNFDKIKADFTLQNKLLNDLKIEFKTLQETRYQKFKNNSVDSVENEYNNTVQTIEKQLHANTNKLSGLLAEITGNENQISENQNLEKQTHQKLNECKSELQPKLETIGYSTLSDALANILSEKNASEIRNKEKFLNDKKISIEQSLLDKKTDFEAIIKNDNHRININQLKLELESDTKKLEEFNQQIGSINARLTEHKKQFESSRELQEKIKNQTKELERWNALSKLIGDAEGKRFTMFAQDLTLIQLIGHANQHLKKLSERYLLKKGDTSIKSDLIAVDLFQGNAERSVRTLSGGESFLVSLALALGLSDLAGKNTKIESLFIDEGFGSLDQEALDAALNSLEKLQQESNRTIGVISHVESLKERIKTQIVLSRASNGHSTIKIVS